MRTLAKVTLSMLFPLACASLLVGLAFEGLSLMFTVPVLWYREALERV